MKEIWHDTWWEKFQKKNKMLAVMFSLHHNWVRQSFPLQEHV